MPGVQLFKCHSDPSIVAQNCINGRSFEYFWSASGIGNDARQNAMLLYTVDPESQKGFNPIGGVFHPLEVFCQ